VVADSMTAKELGLSPSPCQIHAPMHFLNSFMTLNISPIYRFTLKQLTICIYTLFFIRTILYEHKAHFLLNI